MAAGTVVRTAAVAGGAATAGADRMAGGRVAGWPGGRQGGRIEQPGEGMAKKPEAWAREGARIVGDYEIFRVRRDAVRSPRTGALLDRHVLEMRDWVNIVPETTDGRI